MKSTPLFVVSLCMLLLVSRAAAQAVPGSAKAESAYAEIVYVQGSDLLILRANGQTANEDPIGARLLAGDQLQTGAKTSVELVTMPRQSRLRLSENTVVTIGALESDGTTGLNLLYGRLRSKVEKLAGKPSPYKVSSATFVAGVRGTDFGCDVLVARPGEASSTRVYCFEGSVEVGPGMPESAAEKAPESEGAIGGGGAAKASFAPIVVSAGSMALIESAAKDAKVEVVEQPIDQETKSFWKNNDFTAAQPVGGAPPIASPEAQLAKPEALPAPSIDLAPIRRGLAAKNGAIVSASLFFTFGAALEAASFIVRDSNPRAADNLLRGGAACAATGLPILVFAISINPLRGLPR